MMDSTDQNHEVKTGLISMTGMMIHVVILQQSVADRPEQILWKGKVLRCVHEGVVLDLHAEGAPGWRRFLGLLHVVCHWIQKPISIPY